MQQTLPGRLGNTVEPALTLYRDTNGWCPFCERVWIALREKGIPFDEVLVDLYNKPQWFKDMVPTALVPAVKFAASGDVVWESDTIMKRLDTEFPDTRPLFEQEGSVEAALQVTGRLINASMGIAYRTVNLTDEDIEEKRTQVVDAIDELERHIADTGGPFLAGPDLTAADSMAAPMLERFGVQMPYYAAAMQIRDRERWPALAGWYDAMETAPSYAERVQGDAYSWEAVMPVLIRMFSGGNLSAAAAARAADAEAAATQSLDDLEARVAASPAPLLDFGSPEARLEAATKLLGNHEAVVADAVNPEPRSQKELARLPESKAPAVDATLRVLAAALLSGEDSALVPPTADALGRPIDVAEVDTTCRYLAARLCVPRDMGAPAATALRAACLGLARRCG